MQLLSESYQISGVYKSWSNQYPRGRDAGRDKIGDELKKLDPLKSTKHDVARIIGNDSWVKEHSCHECGKESYDIVMVGEPPDYENHTANMCLDCLKAAVQLIESAK